MTFTVRPASLYSHHEDKYDEHMMMKNMARRVEIWVSVLFILEVGNFGKKYRYRLS